MREGSFCWYELVTSDAPAAETFYSQVAGWSVRDSGHPATRYTLASAGGRDVGGLMTLPDEAKRDGAAPQWLGYVVVEDVDAKASAVADRGGRLLRGAQDIPGIGRFAIVADPQGAPFVLFRGFGTPPAGTPGPETPGLFGWHELHSTDWEAAFAFYSGLFGWEKSRAVDMGEMGTYQLFSIGGTDVGGMFNSPQGRPTWLYYINVDAIDAAAERVTRGGGTVVFGPAEVPGGQWIIQARDPQGAMFALVGRKTR